jgi:hypothetical protein
MIHQSDRSSRIIPDRRSDGGIRWRLCALESKIRPRLITCIEPCKTWGFSRQYWRKQAIDPYKIAGFNWNWMQQVRLFNAKLELLRSSCSCWFFSFLQKEEILFKFKVANALFTLPWKQAASIWSSFQLFNQFDIGVWVAHVKIMHAKRSIELLLKATLIVD